MKRTPEEIIRDMRNVVKPGIMNYLKRLNFENLGNEDSAEFEKEFDEVLNLAEEAIKMKSCIELKIKDIDEDKVEALIKALDKKPITISSAPEINVENIKPRLVRYEGDGYADGAMVVDYAYCPNCDHETEVDSENWGCEFCPNCGQRLRWE